MFKVFKRKSKKVISSPQKQRSQSASTTHDSHGVAGIGDTVRPLSYHFGTNDDLDPANSRYQSVDFSSFRAVDEAPISTTAGRRQVERKTSLMSPREAYQRESPVIKQASSMDDILVEAPGSRQLRAAPCPPHRLSSLPTEEAASDTSLPRLKAVEEIRHNSDYDSSSDVENKPPITNGVASSGELKRGHSLTQPSNPQKALHPMNASPLILTHLTNDKPQDHVTAQKTEIKRRATLERAPAVESDAESDRGAPSQDGDPAGEQPIASPVPVSESDSESDPKKAQAFMESLMSSTAASLPAGSGVPFAAAAATKTNSKGTKTEEQSVLSFRDAMKKSRLNSQSSVNERLSPISATVPMPALSTPTRSLSMSAKPDNPTPPPRKARKGRAPKPPLSATQSLSLDQPKQGRMQRSASEQSSLSEHSNSSDQSAPVAPFKIQVTPVRSHSQGEDKGSSLDILQDVDEESSSTSLVVNRNHTPRSDSGISSVDLEELVVKDIKIDKPSEPVSQHHHSDSAVIVEEDYTLPQPFNEKLEPWELSMAQAWEASLAEKNDDVFAEDPTTVATVQPNGEEAWRTKEPSRWTNEDIVEWCEAKKFITLAELLADCGIDGEQFLDISEQDLGSSDMASSKSDLNLNEENRIKILEEIQKLRNEDSESFSPLKQASIRRRNLEASNEALHDHLQKLQELNCEQQESISTYLGELQEEQQRTTHLLAEVSQVEDASVHLDRQISLSMDDLPSKQYPTLDRRQASLTDVSKTGDASWRQLPLVKWTTSDVHSWLKAVDMDRFLPAFTYHNISGKDLAQISMPLLDKLGILAIDDRELILSKLYDLQHSSGAALDDLFPNHSNSTSTTQNKTSCPLQSDVEISSQNSDTETLTPHSITSNLRTIEVWHEMKGSFVSTAIEISANATTENLIETLLHKLNLIEDPNLYGLQSVTLDPRYPDATTDIDLDEHPLEVIELWPPGAQMRLQIQQRPEASIKISNMVSGMKSNVKTVRISDSTRCSGVLKLAYRRFKCQLPADNLVLTYISQSSKSQDYKIISNEEIIANLESDHLYLMEKHRPQLESHARHASELTQSINELKEEVVILKEDIKERDRVIESLQKDKAEIEEESQRLRTEHKDIQKQQVTAEHREKTWQDKCHRLQRELDRLKKIESYADPKAKVQILEAEFKEMTEQVNTQEKNWKHLQQAVNKKRSIVDGHSDDHRLDELLTQQRKAEMTLLILKQEQDSIDVHLQLARSHLEKMQQLSNTWTPLYKVLGSSSFNIVPCDITINSNNLGFLHGRDKEGNLIIKHAEEKSGLVKGDRVLEISGSLCSDLSDLEFSRLLRKATGKLEMVVLRTKEPKHLMDLKTELESVKEDLSMVVLDLESTQMENQELLSRNHQLTDKLSVFENDRDQIKLECVQISKQLAESERLRIELQSSQSSKTANGHAEEQNGVLAYTELGNSVPLWQALESRPKTMALQALKDQILEAAQQKVYLDHLISAVLQSSPDLLVQVDRSVGVLHANTMQLKDSTEEFC